MNKLTANDVHDLMNGIIPLLSSIKSKNKEITKLNAIIFPDEGIDDNFEFGMCEWDDIPLILKKIKEVTGYSDWRLPTTEELFGLIKCKKYIIDSFDKKDFFDDLKDYFVGFYWSDNARRSCKDVECVRLSDSTSMFVDMYDPTCLMFVR